MLQYYYYLELEGFALIICLLLYLNLIKKHSPMLNERVFCYLLLANMAILCVDMLSWISNGNTFAFAGLLLTASDSIYYVMSSIILFLWLLYVALRLTKKRINPIFWILVLIPLVFEVIMSVSAPINGLYFYIDSDNVYHRGPLCWTQAAIGIAFMILAMTIALVRALKTKDLKVRRESLTLVTFTVFPLFCSVLQTNFFGLPLVWIGTTISFMIFFMQTQNSQFSIDALTQLNNRGRFDTYLSQKVRNFNKDETVYLVVIDVDRFKNINDTFGHVTGDEVLIKLADILQKACRAYKDFSARYGGDEFVIVCTRSESEPITPLLEEIEDLLVQLNTQNKDSLQVNISYGVEHLMKTQRKT